MKKKHNKTVFLSKSKLNSIEVLISKTLIDSNITHDEFVSTNNVLKEHDYLKEELKTIKDLKQSIKDFKLFLKQFYVII